jgi:hypothetical protein
MLLVFLTLAGIVALVCNNLEERLDRTIFGRGKKKNQ